MTNDRVSALHFLNIEVNIGKGREDVVPILLLTLLIAFLHNLHETVKDFQNFCYFGDVLSMMNNLLTIISLLLSNEIDVQYIVYFCFYFLGIKHPSLEPLKLDGLVTTVREDITFLFHCYFIIL